MNTAMTKKSVSERIRITKTGKLIKRTMGLGHFRAKKSRRQMRRKSDSLVNPVDIKMFRKYISI